MIAVARASQQCLPLGNPSKNISIVDLGVLLSVYARFLFESVGCLYFNHIVSSIEMEESKIEDVEIKKGGRDIKDDEWAKEDFTIRKKYELKLMRKFDK